MEKKTVLPFGIIIVSLLGILDPRRNNISEYVQITNFVAIL